MITLDEEFIGWLALWAYRFHAIVVFWRGSLGPQPVFFVLPIAEVV